MANEFHPSYVPLIPRPVQTSIDQHRAANQVSGSPKGDMTVTDINQLRGNQNLQQEVENLVLDLRKKIPSLSAAASAPPPQGTVHASPQVTEQQQLASHQQQVGYHQDRCQRPATLPPQQTQPVTTPHQLQQHQVAQQFGQHLGLVGHSQPLGPPQQVLQQVHQFQ